MKIEVLKSGILKLSYETKDFLKNKNCVENYKKYANYIFKNTNFEFLYIHNCYFLFDRRNKVVYDFSFIELNNNINIHSKYKKACYMYEKLKKHYKLYGIKDFYIYPLK